jgi:cephalosporin hydroxylase
MTLATRYRELCAIPSDIHEHLPTLVDLVRNHNAQHVIELGTRTGTSTVALLHALEDTGGRLTSIDIEPAPDIGTFDHWTFIQGDDLDPAVTAQLAPADIVFIDTSHHYDQTLKELNLYRWFTRRGGLMVCHDTELEHPYGAPAYPRFPVKTAVEEYCATNGFQWTNRPNCWGLGIIEVR